MNNLSETAAISHELLVILDCGAQYVQLIARNVRELGVYAEIWPFSKSAAELKASGAKAIIISGSNASVNDEGSPKIDPEIFNLGIPVLGICYGAQVMAHQLDGEVGKASAGGEYNKTLIISDSQLLDKPGKQFQALMSHMDQITRLPAGFSATGRTQSCPVAMMEDKSRRLYGVQFHPEVKDTEGGKGIIDSFLRISGFAKDWKMSNVIDEETAKIKALSGNDKVICALSGGVDSLVAATMVHNAIGDRLTCIFVDNGLMRYGEVESIDALFTKRFGKSFVHVNASERFLGKLAGVSEPEEKRKIIGTEFIRVFEEEAAKVGGAKWLVQGTIYPDVVESGATGGAVIKRHHNVGGLPEKMNLKLLEPLRSLFKDEVREIGRQLGLPEEHIKRQPFPGPGLAIRIIGGAVNRELLTKVALADFIVRTEIEEAGLDRELGQYFAAMPANLKTVGVKGDERSYEPPVFVRTVATSDFMTAQAGNIPYEVQQKIAKRICDEVKGINRVLFDASGKPPGTIEYE
jgi:GMP synthase (glutamine-hydrolysing)